MTRLTALEVFAMLDARVRATGSHSAVAQSLGVTPKHFQECLRIRREPSKQIIEALSLRRVVLYEVM